MITLEQGWVVLYTIHPRQLRMIEYLTPSRDFSPHVYQAEVFQEQDQLDQALRWMRSNGYPPSATLSDWQPPTRWSKQPTYPGAWRQFP